VSGALPLEELAARGSQPLLRMAVAWLPAGFAAGLALALATRLRTAAVALSTGVLALLILGSTTVASEAVSHNETFVDNIKPALHRSGLWTAIAFAVIGSILAVAAARAGPRGRVAESSGARAGGFWAA
jgi:TRAP-type C4-dicarboxylate transport system permease small subunit